MDNKEEPTLSALEDTIITEGEEAEKRKEIRVNTPLKDILQYLTTADFSSWKQEHVEFIKKLQVKTIYNRQKS